jgi:nitroimidazol reductase NimA-like FMN-containing flavoprotein (pyridoxamine 5'-phosphate oxidase superfamily)
MAQSGPHTEIDARFSSEGASPTDWSEGHQRIEEAKIFWVTTVRPDGRPHVTPLISVWLEDAAFFCTGQDERKARNLAANPSCILTTGCNDYDAGLDIVIEGEATRVTDEARLQRIADAYEAKYGAEWHFDVADGAFHSQGETEAWVFELAPAKVLGFGKGEVFSQTRWVFNRS